MSVVPSLLAQILHIGVMIVAAVTVAGVMDWIEAQLSGRSGSPVLSPWRDLVRLARKTPMTTGNISVVSQIASALGLGATLSAAVLVPSFTLGMTLAPLSNMLVIVSLLTVARIAAVFVALDSGAALPGLAAQNNSALGCIAEPALLLSVVALALMGGSFNLDFIIGQQREGLLLPAGASAIAATAMLALLLAETSATVSGLDHMLSGPELAMSRMTGWLRRLVWIDLIGGLFLPVGMAIGNSPLAWLIGMAFWGIKLTAFVLGLSMFQTMLGPIPRHSLPDLIGVAALLAVLAIVMVVASAGTA